jgi:ABC-2 type transport system permease protein
MSKISIIISREYWSRVKKPQFLLITLGAPILLALLFFVLGWILSYSSNESKTLLISDPGQLLNETFQPTSAMTGVFSDKEKTDLFQLREQENYDGILILPEPDSAGIEDLKVQYYAPERLNIDVDAQISSYLNTRIREWKIQSFGIDTKLLDQLDTDISIASSTNLTFDEEEELEEGSSIAPYVASAIGLIIAFLIYFMVFINGMMIMRSVMEEKVSRIVEIMISTVRPFQLMMGKLIGVGAVGVTQIVSWMVLIPILILAISLVFGLSLSGGANPAAEQMGESGAMDTEIVENVIRELLSYNWWLIGISFLLYYVGGYLLYSSLFGAMGAMMGDDLGESNSLSIIVTIPVVLALYIGIVAAQSPNSPLAVWSSMFPLFSPIVMPCRLAYDPPLWQIGISILLLFVATYGIVLFSAKIYRVGILMYGKKAGFKEIIKWMRR